VPKVQGSTAGPRGSYASRRLGLAEQYLRSPALEHVERLSKLLLGDTDRLGRVFAPGKAPRRRLEMQGNGGPAGWAYVSNGRSVAVTVDYAVDPGRYDIRLTTPDGTQETLGSMRVYDERGSWTGRSEQTIENGSTIALIDASGHEVCRGTVSV